MGTVLIMRTQRGEYFDGGRISLYYETSYDSLDFIAGNRLFRYTMEITGEGGEGRLITCTRGESQYECVCMYVCTYVIIYLIIPIYKVP